MPSSSPLAQPSDSPTRTQRTRRLAALGSPSPMAISRRPHAPSRSEVFLSDCSRRHMEPPGLRLIATETERQRNVREEGVKIYG